MNTKREEDILVVELDGVLDSHTAADFKSWLEEKLLQGLRAFALDCRNLKYLSSKGIGAILEIHNLAIMKNAAFVLFKVSNEVLRLLEFLKVTDEIKVFEKFDDALPYLNEHPIVQETTNHVDNVNLPSGKELEDIASNDKDPVHKPRQTQIEVIDDTKEATATSQTKELLQADLPSPQEESALENIAADDNNDNKIKDGENKLVHSTSKPNQDDDSIEPIKTKVKEAVIDATLEHEELDLTGHIDDEIESKPKTIFEKDNNQHKNSSQDGKSLQVKNVSDELVPTTSIAVKLIFCPNCGTQLRVSKPGKYLCPSCRVKFKFPF